MKINKRELVGGSKTQNTALTHLSRFYVSFHMYMIMFYIVWFFFTLDVVVGLLSVQIAFVQIDSVNFSFCVHGKLQRLRSKKNILDGPNVTFVVDQQTIVDV